MDKGIQEFEQELLKVAPGVKQITPSDLLSILATLNQRIRFSGLSAREILLKREQNTGQQLSFSDKALSTQQHLNREKNHLPSARAKAKGAKLASNGDVTVGSLVYIKSEMDKFNTRPMYIVSALREDHVTLQKFVGSQLSSRRYVVPLTQVFPISSQNCSDDRNKERAYKHWSDSDSEKELGWLPNASRPFADNESLPPEDAASSDSEGNEADEESSSSEDAAEQPPLLQEQAQVLRPQRQRQPPQWHKDYDMSQRDAT